MGEAKRAAEDATGRGAEASRGLEAQRRWAKSVAQDRVSSEGLGRKEGGRGEAGGGGGENTSKGWEERDKEKWKC